jgi:hypothetical protein
MRAVVYGIGISLAAGAVMLALAAFISAAVCLAIWGVLLIVGLLIERWRYKPLSGPRPGPDWIATDERFIDPESGKLVTVYYQPATGERRYIAL